VKTLRKGSCSVVAGLMALILAHAAFAGEGQHYPNGAEDCFCGIAPPPGWHIVNYLLYFDADKMTLSSGDVPINLDLWADVVRVIYSSNKKILGGNYLCHVFVPYIDVDMKGPMSYSDSGVADPIIDPFIIAWHGQTYHAVAGLDVYVPVGEYDKNSSMNLVGRNFWTFEPVVAVTGLYKCGFSWSLKMMYDFNTKNDEYLNPMTGHHCDLEPGDEFHVDYAFDYGVCKHLRLGVSGYYYKQLEDDEIGGVKDLLGFGKAEAFAVGPVLMCSPLKNLHLVAKAQFEVDSQNKAEGNAYWFKVIYSF
jgi:hypothetical protein